MSGEKDEIVLLTGVTGFIAGHILVKLVESGFTRIRGTTRAIKPEKQRYLKKICPDLKLFSCDLTRSKNWASAIDGCTYVIHTTNPMPDLNGDPNAPVTVDDFVKPALDGMTRLLNLCRDSQTVKKVVYTSSVASMDWYQNIPRKKTCVVNTGNEWTSIGNDKVTPYAQSKTMSEKYAWDWLKTNDYPFDFVSINPAMVCGPILHERIPASLNVFYFGLTGRVKLIPHIHFGFVDVRDVAEAHVKALTCENANGKRYLLSGQTSWLKDVYRYLKMNGYPHVYDVSIPTWILTSALTLKMDWPLRDQIARTADITRFVDGSLVTRDLKVVYRPLYQSIEDMLASLHQFHLIPDRIPSNGTGNENGKASNSLEMVKTVGKVVGLGGCGYLAYRAIRSKL